MNYYTYQYKIQTQLEGFPNILLVGSSRRWFCGQFRERITNHLHTFTLIDNYGSIYSLRVEQGVSGEIIIESERLRIDLFSNPNTISIPLFSITDCPFPDFLIDVLQTIHNPVGVETLRRTAKEFAKIDR